MWSLKSIFHTKATIKPHENLQTKDTTGIMKVVPVSLIILWILLVWFKKDLKLLYKKIKTRTYMSGFVTVHWNKVKGMSKGLNKLLFQRIGI